MQKGFTLIELMITISIIAIIAVIAYPSYTQFLLKNDASKAQTRMLELSHLLEKHKSQNFSYKGFPISSEDIGDPKKYTITIVGAVAKGSGGTEKFESITHSGASWAMKAISEDTQNYSYLMNNQGLKCRNKSANKVTYSNCGEISDGSETW